MTRDNDIADQLFGNSAPITTLKSSLLSLSSRLEHSMSEIRDMTYGKNFKELMQSFFPSL